MSGKSNGDNGFWFVSARMAADAQMMTHFYSPLHHMWGSSLHPSRYPTTAMDSKYQNYEQKYPSSEPTDPRYPHSDQKYNDIQEQKHHLPQKCQGSPGSSPQQNMESYSSGHPGTTHEETRSYIAPPGQLSPTELRDIKPLHEAVNHDNDKDVNDSDIMKSSIDQPNDRNDDKAEFPSSHGVPEYPGYYHQPDLSHPSYGGYSTTGPFSSPLSRPRANKTKAQSGKSTSTNL